MNTINTSAPTSRSDTEQRMDRRVPDDGHCRTTLVLVNVLDFGPDPRLRPHLRGWPDALRLIPGAGALAVMFEGWPITPRKISPILADAGPDDGLWSDVPPSSADVGTAFTATESIVATTSTACILDVDSTCPGEGWSALTDLVLVDPHCV